MSSLRILCLPLDLEKFSPVKKRGCFSVDILLEQGGYCQKDVLFLSFGKREIFFPENFVSVQLEVPGCMLCCALSCVYGRQ